jgi:hypothetical protein
MKWALLVSFYANRDAFPTMKHLGIFKQIQLINTPPGLTGFEENVMATAVLAVTSLFSTVSSTFAPLVRFVDDLAPEGGQETKLTCFREALVLARNEVYFANNKGKSGGCYRPHCITRCAAASVWQEAALHHLDIAAMAPPPCKPTRAVIVAREEVSRFGETQVNSRPLWNIDALRALLDTKGIRSEVAYVSGRWPFRNQAMLFHDADLLISAHSSQLTNVLFSRPGTAVIELMPHKYDNRVFQRIGLPLRVDYRVVQCPLPSQSDKADEARKLYGHLDGDACLRDPGCRGLHRNLGVEADLEQVDRALDSTLHRMAQVC